MTWRLSFKLGGPALGCGKRIPRAIAPSIRLKTELVPQVGRRLSTTLRPGGDGGSWVDVYVKVNYIPSAGGAGAGGPKSHKNKTKPSTAGGPRSDRFGCALHA